MKKTIYITLLVAVTCFYKASAQDPHFSQFFEAPLLRNPSLAGLYEGDIRVQGVYRNQWGSVTDAFKTGSFNVEYKQPVGKANDFLTTGLQILYDRAGTTNLTTTNVLPAINYHKAMSTDKSKYLSLGFMGGWVQRRIDRSKITTDNTYTNGTDGESLLNANYSYLDGSVGMSFNSTIADRPGDNYFVGLAYHHFNRPKNSFYNNRNIELNPKWVFSTGVKFAVNENTLLNIQADYSKQGIYQETILGAMYGYKIGADYDKPDYILYFGGFLRWNDAFIPVLKLDYHPFSVGFSYDANVSALKTASQSRGGFELSVTYAGFLDRGNTTKESVMCPRF